MFDLTLKRIIIKKDKIPRRKPGLNLINKKGIKNITGLDIESYKELVEQLKELIIDRFNCHKYSIEDQLIVAAFYMRENLTMRAIETLLNVDKDTVSNIVRRLSSLIGLIKINPIKDKEIQDFYLIDGTLVPSSDKRVAEFSRNKKSSANIQILADKNSKLVLISSVSKGNVHDSKAYREGIKEYLEDNNIKSKQVIGDLGYYGVDNIRTPIKKPYYPTRIGWVKDKPGKKYKESKSTKLEYRDLTAGEKNYNIIFRRERCEIERVIAHLKSWKLLRHSRLRSTMLEDIISSISTMYNLNKIFKYGVGYIVNSSIKDVVENVIKQVVVM